MPKTKSAGISPLTPIPNSGAGFPTDVFLAPGSPYDLEAPAFAVSVADVNRDRRNDLVMATVDSVTVWLGGKDGFAPAPGSPFRAGPGTYNLALGDINNDGKLDVAAPSFEGAAVTVLLGR